MGLLRKNSDELGFYTLNLVPLVVTSARTLKGRPTSFLQLNNATTSIAVTIDAPKPGWLLVISQRDAGTVGHTVTLTSGTFDGTNDVATLNAQNETLVLLGVSLTRFVVVENIGSVALS